MAEDSADFTHAIAIIGMAGRFPGASTVDEFWKNICAGVESIARFADDQLEDTFDADIRSSPKFVKARPILADVDQFDAEFFGIYAREAELIDPQQRLFLESAWHALEDGGYDPEKFPGNIGVFAGSSVNTYFLRNVCQNRQTIDEFTDCYQVGSYSMLTGASQDFLATRVSYKLNLRGPSITVQSACSTSLLAVAQACQSLLLYQSDMALAGGVSITFPQQRGYLSQEGGMVSADGHCRSFDADASGTVFGSGLGVVLLKRLEEAVRDGDHIYASILGCGVNNDGATKVGFTAPSIEGQATAIAMAIANAGVDARSIGYVECHGTATPLGDPIEIAGLTKAFRTYTDENGFCAVGSVKTNVGHLDAAAGVTGLIKVALSLSHRQLPASLHFKKPNPQIDFDNSPFYVNAGLCDWESATVRRAGVSAFGVGGTNVHAILEEPPDFDVHAHDVDSPHIVVLSARSEAALAQMRSNLAHHVMSTRPTLADVTYTLQVGRRHFQHRYAVVCERSEDLAAKLAVAQQPEEHPGSLLKRDSVIAFLFSGESAQSPSMVRELYESEATFRYELDACAELLLPIISRDIRQAIFVDAAESDAAKILQPILFSIEYSLAKLWMSWGIQPQLMLGIGSGEWVAAVLAQVMSLADALCLVAISGDEVARSKRLHERLHGVRLSPPTIPLVSCVTGKPLTAIQATSTDYWMRHVHAPVRFADCIAALASQQTNIFIEVGFGNALTMEAKRTLGASFDDAVLVTSLPTAASGTRAVVHIKTSIAKLWIKGIEPNWRALYRVKPHRIPLPVYPFERRRYWIDVAGKTANPQSDAAMCKVDTQSLGKAGSIASELCALFEELVGERRVEIDSTTTFLELGFDSLFLTQVAQQVEHRYQVKVTFRQLFGELASIPSLANYLEDSRGASKNAPQRTDEDRMVGEAPTRFKVYTPTKQASHGKFTAAQRRHIEELSAQYCVKTAGSKRYTQSHRAVLADPRAAAGFRAEWKEMVYPIVAARALGANIWDIDGNEYIDLVNGYGQTAFGHSPQFVVDAVQAQLAKGFAIGPQAELVGEVASLISELTGNERVAFCNTGSEAVMAAMRIARAVTGRDKVVVFEGAYHGQFDEVLVHSTHRGATPKSLPVAAGIPTAAVQNMVVLEYAASASLQWIREHASDIAAVIVEPVQSRRPQLQPTGFLRELREVTMKNDIAFVMDEVVTGFRVHPGGMQAVLGIRADLVTYGKVVGGGLPIGIVAGAARFMDALDGGQWQYGDDSFPQIGVTFFAGTFVRHPLALAATHAVLLHLRNAGQALQENLSKRMTKLVESLNEELASAGVAARIHSFASWFYFSIGQEAPLASLLFQHLRLRGIHIQEGFPCFITTAHSDADLQRIVAAFRESLQALGAVGIVGDASPPLEREVSSPQRVALTESQMEIWLAAQAGEEASCAFNESITLRMRGTLDEAALQRALHKLMQLHDALRASFTMTGEEMVIAPSASLPLQVVDVRLQVQDMELQLRSLVERDACTAFDLVHGPVIRAYLLKLDADTHALVLTAHHIVCDGWSFNIIVNELGELYRAECESRLPELPVPMQFTAYAEASHRQATEERAKIERYWLRQFAVPPARLNLPTDRQRNASRSYLGATICRYIDADLYQRVKKLGAAHGSTLFATLLAAFQVLLGRLAQQNEVVIGVPFAGQSLLDDATLVGHAVNFLPLRQQWNAQSKVSEVLSAVSKQVLDARDHQHFTLGTLVQKLLLPCDFNRLPVTEVQFNLERLAEGLQLPGLQVQIEPNPKFRVVFDLFLNITESAQGLRLDCSYKTELFNRVTVERWLECYEAQLISWATNSSQPILQAEYLPALMREQLLTQMNSNSSSLPTEMSVGDLLHAQAMQRPDANAVRCGDNSLTYEQLWQRVEQLAHYLVGRIPAASATAQARIGICMQRSIDMLVALLATWRAGYTYVPLDPNNPPARLKYILAEADATVLLVDDAKYAEWAASSVMIVNVKDAGQDEGWHASKGKKLRSSCAEDIAYLIYTSGSTGLPKGVEITHGAVVNLLMTMARNPGLDVNDVLVAVTTLSFDIAVLELLLPLCVGAQVVIATGDEVLDGKLLARRIVDAKANVLQATPATWRLLLEAGFEADGRFKMLCGGEPLPRELANRLLAGGGELWNMYGPTETTVWSSCTRVLPGDAPITVGRPIANTQFYILDAQDQLMPFGMPGQLHIGGAGIARGYFKREALNAEKFIANPFGNGKLYRTGDRARYLENGEVQLLGRIDQQIKLRGYRIELGEIEAVLRQHQDIEDAAVALREEIRDDARLVGYVVGRTNQLPSSAQLREYLATQLPDYMIPTAWVNLSALPRLPNGKLDRAALPAPAQMPQKTRAHIAPSTEAQVALARIWSEVLQTKNVGISDDLFSLGADSIHCFKIVARANEQNLRITAKQLIQHRTIEALTRALEAGSAITAQTDVEMPAALSIREFKRQRATRQSTASV